MGCIIDSYVGEDPCTGCIDNSKTVIVVQACVVSENLIVLKICRQAVQVDPVIGVVEGSVARERVVVGFLVERNTIVRVETCITR